MYASVSRQNEGMKVMCVCVCVCAVMSYSRGGAFCTLLQQ